MAEILSQYKSVTQRITLRWLHGVDVYFCSVVTDYLEAHCKDCHFGSWNGVCLHSHIWKGWPFSLRMLVKYRVPAPVKLISYRAYAA